MLKRSIMPRRRFWAVGHAAAFVLTFLALNAVGADDCLSLHDDDVRELVEDGPLTVHLVPHTHDDVGWLKTPDQYLWGANNTIQVADVSLILDAVTRELARDPMRTFVYGEVFFLSHWWRQQDRSTHDLVRSLVGSGQLQLVNGGWVQHDEATAAFPDMLDQTARGHAFLKAALDVSDARCIVGWQIDPFGHSAAHVDLLTRLHAPGLFFGRMHHEELNARRRAGELEFRWDPFGNGEGGVLTRASWSGNYGPPPSFNFETFVGDEPVMDDPSEVACNAARRAWEFVRAAQDIAEFYSPRQSEGGVGDEMRHVMVEMGTDFTYMGAGAWFRNMDRLRAHVERLFPGSIRVVYSTPLSYLTAKYGSQALGIDDASCPQAPWMGRQRSGSAGGGEVPAAASRRLAMDVGAVGRQQGALAAISGAWGRAYGSVSIGDVPVRGGDFFPYADNPHAYWIGYFTSRPAHKYLARHASNVLRAARAMAALCGPRCGDSRDFLDPLESAVSTMQHHDAITGTAKQHVADDYARRLHGGVQATLKLAQEYLGGSWQLCPLANASYCMETMDVEAFEMASFNSLGWSAASWVTLPVSADTVRALLEGLAPC
ncbi:unnamed protein product [Pedinophyceae sp. YPF-701]|nr:unnamed protein product [Pedinophyceae sp. YPF-701]